MLLLSLTDLVVCAAVMFVCSDIYDLLQVRFVICLLCLQHKCAMYWPSKKEKMKHYGVLKVTFLGEEVFAHYTVRTLELKPLDGSTHYTQVCCDL